MLNTILAGIMGILLALAATVIVELGDRRARAPGDIVEVLGVPVLGEMGAVRYVRDKFALPPPAAA